MEKLPLDTRNLIAQLNYLMPARCPRIDESDREIWMYAGRRALIDQLIALAHNSRISLDLQGDPFEY